MPVPIVWDVFQSDWNVWGFVSLVDQILNLFVEIDLNSLDPQSVSLECHQLHPKVLLFLKSWQQLS